MVCIFIFKELGKCIACFNPAHSFAARNINYFSKSAAAKSLKQKRGMNSLLWLTDLIFSQFLNQSRTYLLKTIKNVLLWKNLAQG